MQQEMRQTSRVSLTVHVRVAAEGDAVALHRFASDLVGERLSVLFRRDKAPSIEEQRNFIERIARTPRSALFVAEAGGEIVGMLDFHGHQKPQRAHAGEFGMSVARPWRGRGIGSQLLAHLFAWASAQNMRRLELSVFANNAPAIALYERAGFVREGVQRDAIEIDGGLIDMVQMAKTLPVGAAVGPAA
jgi:RimJ/RimL family protein N-acetyltransferase